MSQLIGAEDERLIVGPEQDYDAAVYAVSDELALVLTVDCITPVHDDPEVFGRIAAINSLSDVWAMGARPAVALNVLGFPQERLDWQVARRIAEGGAAALAELGVALGGGHTMDSPEPFYGLAVAGVVEPARIVRISGARPGDALVLTKPIGIGIVTTAMMAGIASAEAAQRATRIMLRPNRAAAEAMVEHGAHAATDVTGFGLVGHGHEMAAASDVAFVIHWPSVPVVEEALEYARQWCIPAGLQRNRRYYAKWVDFSALTPEQAMLACDPQTSGGLLIALPLPAADQLVESLREQGEDAWVIGRVEEGPVGRIVFTS